VIPSLPERKTFKGHDAYCHLCWNAVYVMWIDEEPPDYEKCPFGDHDAVSCPDAQSRAGLRAFLAKCERDGLLKPKAEGRSSEGHSS